MNCLFVLILFMILWSIGAENLRKTNIAAIGIKNTGGGFNVELQKGDRRQDYCMSDMFKRCLLKNEVGFYGIFVNGGNPCFVYNGGRVSIPYVKVNLCNSNSRVSMPEIFVQIQRQKIIFWKVIILEVNHS